MSDTISAFRRYFEVVVADTPALLEHAYRLRYEVYCDQDWELHLDPADFPDGLETDEYDQRAVHCLLRHRPTGAFAGTVRLILHDPGQPDAPFPIESCASAYFDPTVLNLRSIPRSEIAEVSRLLLSHRFRSRSGERDMPQGIADVRVAPGGQTERGAARHRRVSVHPFIGLGEGLVRMSAEHGISYWYLFIEQRLVRLLRRFGMEFQALSDDIAFHGTRRAYIAYLPEFLGRIHAKHPDVWALLTDAGAVCSAAWGAIDDAGAG